MSERQRHYRLVSRMYALCRSGEWHLRLARLLDGVDAVGADLVDEHGAPVRNCEGTVIADRHEICVDYRADLLATFVHECLHVLCDHRFGPDDHEAEEAWVREHEALVMRHLSPVQARRLLGHIAALLARPREK